MCDAADFTLREPTPETDAERIARLSTLEPIEYDKVRRAEADAIGVRVSTLDAAVEAARPKPEAATGRSVGFPVVEPWPEPVAAADLLGDLARAIRRHMVLSDAATIACAGWIMHTWVADRFQHTPRLSITSPAKRCGKSTLLDVLRATCLRPLKADNISASGTFRTVEALSPVTLLIDEADAFLGENEELRGILNSGFEQSGEVIRVVEVKDEHQPVRFRTFAPVALAGIGSLPGTLEDRAIPIVLQRKAAGETVTKLRARGARADLHDLARRCARWAQDRGAHLDRDPAVPDAMGDREGDITVPLLSIADDAGGDWPARMRRALLDLFGKRNADEGSADAGALLLADLKAMFAELSATRLSSAQIVERLAKMEERPWAEWRRGQPMTAPQLAAALRPFGVRRTTIRIGQEVSKGYHREAFAEAWDRYLAPAHPLPPVDGGAEPSHRYKQGNAEASGDFRAVTPLPHVTAAKTARAAENLGCNGVTAEKPPWGRKGVWRGGWRNVEGRRRRPDRPRHGCWGAAVSRLRQG
jgi:putative DNA primase/helicase